LKTLLQAILAASLLGYPKIPVEIQQKAIDEKLLNFAVFRHYL
jgi:hypothetical protein